MSINSKTEKGDLVQKGLESMGTSKLKLKQNKEKNAQPLALQLAAFLRVNFQLKDSWIGICTWAYKLQKVVEA